MTTAADNTSVSTPSLPPLPPTAGKTPTPSVMVNNRAMKDLESLGSTFKSMIRQLVPDQEVQTPSHSTPSEITISSATQQKKRKFNNKLERKQRKKRELMEQIEFLEPRKESNTTWYNELQADYRKVSKEITQLLDEMETEEEKDEN